ncbi:MAG: hypothetical protein MUF15_25090, partial [Acidobacteria bacterium]|nr:hypothetical protein [Acidobacteriota bacterium]
MKKFILVIVCLAMPYFAPGENIEKVVLVPIDSGAPLNIENLYISPQENDPPLVAFYGEDGANIYVYNTVSRKMRAFQFKIGRSRVEETSFSFVTFCWDLEAYGDFA